MAREDEFHDDNPPPPVTPTQQAPHTLSTIKLPILKKGEYDIWAMKMEHYVEHTDYPIWEVIQKGNGPVQVSTDTNGQIRVLPPKTTEEFLARERERKARTTLLMAIPEEHLAKFHKMTDSKEIWEAIKSRFGVSTEDANQKFLRSLPASWSQVSLIMRTKPGVDTLSFDDLYNNLRVFESDIKGSTASSSSTQNVAFVSSESTNSTNDVSTAYGVSTSSGHNSQKEGSSSYTDELKYSFFANQSSGPQLDHEDLEQVDEFDLEEMDLKWQVAMISMRLKKFYKKTGRRLQFDAKEPVGFDKTKVECFNCHNTGHFARECRSKGNQESRRRDAGNTGYKAKDNGKRPGKQEEPKALVTLDGECSDWTGHAKDEQENFALTAYNNSGSDTEVTSCSKECVESYAKLKKLYDEQREQLGDASIEIKAYTLALAKMSTRDKSGLESSDVEDSPVYDRFVKVKGMHAVPPPMTGNYMPPKSDFGIDELNFTYGPKQSKTSESDDKTSDFDSCKTNSSIETLEYVPEPVVVKPKVVSQPKVWSDAPIIEEYESDSDDEYVIEPSKEQEKPNFAFVNTVKHVKTPRESVKEQNTCRPSPKVNKRDWNGSMSKRLGLGYGFSKKACFIYGSFSHLIRDCDFHEKRMAKQVELNKKKGKGNSLGENRPVWNNVQRLNHQKKFVPKAVLTKTGIFPVNIARQNLSSTARKINTARPIGNPQVALKDTGIFDREAHDVYYALKYDWKDLLHQTKSVKHIGKSKEVRTLRYLSLVVPLTKVGDEAVHKELGNRMERAATIASSLKVEQDSATARTSATREVKLTATINGQEKTITEASLRRHLKLEDNGGVTTIPNSEIFKQLSLMGYETDSDKLSFQMCNFSPQWRFFIHIILHYLSLKKTAWEQFSSNITTAIIRLATTKTFNFSKFIFDAMRLLQPHTRTYSTPVLTHKVFSNMKRVTKGYSGEDTPLFASMITASETSPSRITSSSSLSPQHTPFTAPFTF
ncbi:putative ribonuclease H-like domain-containing protein [Tanacetum coccineum]|uniref:Ribonuclease H-like domain-containing protein n=1 Tax=Tanacetum coccineum TaxID=301880 RepID=A0ABQ4Z9W8_9ASTR